MLVHVDKKEDLIVECMGYERERTILINEVKTVFGNDFFKRCDVEDHKGMCKLLRLIKCSDSIMDAMQVFLKIAWRKRCIKIDRAN